METQHYNGKKSIFKKRTLHHGVSTQNVNSEHAPVKMESVIHGTELKAKCAYKNVINDSIMLRESFVQQAIILISQV